MEVIDVDCQIRLMKLQSSTACDASQPYIDRPERWPVTAMPSAWFHFHDVASFPRLVILRS